MPHYRLSQEDYNLILVSVKAAFDQWEAYWSKLVSAAKEDETELLKYAEEKTEALGTLFRQLVENDFSYFEPQE